MTSKNCSFENGMKARLWKWPEYNETDIIIIASAEVLNAI